MAGDPLNPGSVPDPMKITMTDDANWCWLIVINDGDEYVNEDGNYYYQLMSMIIDGDDQWWLMMLMISDDWWWLMMIDDDWRDWLRLIKIDVTD